MLLPPTWDLWPGRQEVIPSRTTSEIELEPGEKLAFSESLIAHVEAGRWLVTIHPLLAPIRSHSAFLNSYVPEDEGLYDDYPPR